MNEMIERVAKALRERLDITLNEHDGFYEGLARAAIEAMREPTDEMMVDGEWKEKSLMTFAPREESPSLRVWQAMIDSALKDG
jgi:hypothetical protein